MTLHEDPAAAEANQDHSLCSASDNPLLRLAVRSVRQIRNIQSIAVLPLKSLNDDETSKAISLGLANALISRLGSLNRLIVRPFDAVDKYAKSGGDPVRLASELKVDAVLEGTVQMVDQRIRVNLRLVDGRDGAQIWTASFVEAFDDVFKLQDRLAVYVANSLVASISSKEGELLAKRDTGNAEAYLACMRGRAILDQKNFELVDKAIEAFQESIAHDPTFALPYVGLADAFLMKNNVLSQPDTAYFRKAKLYAQKAIELDAASAEVYTVLGRIKRNDNWNWEGAEKDFVRAVQINPNHAEALRYLAQMHSFLGRHDEALSEINRAIAINPISPTITTAQFSILESHGDYAEGLKRAEEFYQSDKNSTWAKRAVATFRFNLGEYARVIEISESLTANDERQKFAFLSLLASSYLKTNQPNKAAEVLRQLEQLAQSDTKALYSLAMNYAELGRIDDALWALEKCFELREERIVWINVEPRFAVLRNNSRLQAIATRIGLKQSPLSG